jgi:hypothetical protein
MMPKENISVIPNQRGIPGSEFDKTVAELAYNLWLSSAFRGNSPEQALVAALQMVRGKGPARLFVVPKRDRLTDA